MAAVAAMSLPGAAKAEGFKATDNCLQVLQGITDVDRVLLGAWIMGYLDNTNDQASLVRMDNAMTVLSNLGQVCAKGRLCQPDSMIAGEIVLQQYPADNGKTQKYCK